MKLILLFLALCLSATAALPPLPVIKRPAPLLSPKHAAAPKSTPMLRQTLAVVGSELPKKLPMKASCVMVDGVAQFTGQATQPANKSILFEMSSPLTEGSWVTLVWFGPYPVAQEVFAMVPSDQPHGNIRATASVAPSATMSRVVAVGADIRKNPDVRGLQAWRGVR